MHRTIVGWALAASGLAIAELLIPVAVPGEPSMPLALVGALAGLFFSAILFWIAWSAGEWGPAFLALGCISMATAGAAHLGASSAYALIEPGGVGDQLPAIGMIVGGFWFGLGAVPRQPVAAHARHRPRITLILLAAMIVIAATLLAPMVEAPPEPTLRVLAPFGSLGYLYAGAQMLQAYSLLHLPSQCAMSIGSFLFVPVTLASAAGGFPILPSWFQQALGLAVAALPAAGFVVEHRQRPGLRTMVLALSLPGAVRGMRRGYPAQLMDLLAKVDEHDPALGGHIDRVADLAVQTGHVMGLDAGLLREVMLAGQLHDVGKLFISRDLLDKPGRLDAGEMERVQEHSALGAALVQRIPELAAAATAVRQHHEKWDGSGYPAGLDGENIQRSARIIAAADVFDALVTERPYKRAWSPQEALAELQQGAGTHFDPAVVTAMEAVLGEAAGVVDAETRARAA